MGSCPTPTHLLIGISPNSATVGDPPVTLTVSALGGGFFEAGEKVRFNGVVLGAQTFGKQQIVATIPASMLTTAGTVQVEVVDTSQTNLNGKNPSISNSVPFTVNPVPTPTVTSISPSSVVAGSGEFTLTVNGTNFVPKSVVQLGGASYTTTFVSATQLTVEVPAVLVSAVQDVLVGVVNPNHIFSNTVKLTVTAILAPTIVSISPSTVVAGSPPFTVTVIGMNFVPGSVVLLNGGTVTTTFVSATKLSFTVPAPVIQMPTTVLITVRNSTNTAPSNAVTLTVTALPAPTIVSISPTSVMAGVGTTLAVTGTNFVSGSVVMINSQALTTTFSDSMRLFAIIPGTAVPTPGTAQITVVNPPQQGGTSNAVTLTITQTATLAITPTTLPDGLTASPYTQVLTVTGGTGPFTWTVSSGTLPAGLTLTPNGATAMISGTPTTVQVNVMFTITVTDTSNNAMGSQPYTVSILVTSGNHDSQITGPNVVYLEGADNAENQVTIMLSYTADGKGAGTNCLVTIDAATILNQAPCTINYNVSNSNMVTMTATSTALTSPLTFAGNVDSAGNAGVILTGGPANLISGASGDLLKQDPTAFTVPAQQGQHFFVLGGKWNGSLFASLGEGLFNNAGNANPSTLDFAQPANFQFQSGDALFQVNTISPVSGCGTGIASFLGAPPNFDSFQSNQEICVVNSQSIVGVGTDPAGVSFPDRIHVITHDSTNRDVGRLSIGRPTVGPQGSQQTTAESLAAAAANPAQLNGAYTARLQGVSGSGATATNSVMLFKFLADGAGNITSGILDQNNGGTLTSSVNISNSTYTVDATTPGRVTIHLNSNGQTLIDNDFTAYIGASAGGTIMAGTTAHPSTHLGIGVLRPQGGFPFSPASFGAGCPVTSVPPVAASNWTLTGSMDFSAGITNFTGTFSFVQGGTATSGQAITGTFTLTDPNTGRFTGTLNGLPGTAGAVVGYLNGTNLFSFDLSTSATSSALMVCTGS
jgi:hypothetical protein